MQSFEFLMVTISIVVGLGIAEVLGVVIRVLRREVTPGWLHSLWMLTILVFLLQALWASWAYQVRTDWSFTDMTVLLAPRLFLFVAAGLLSPPPGRAGSLDEYLMDIRGRLYGALVGFNISASLAFNLLGDGPGVQDAIRGGLTVLYLALATSERRGVQLAGVLIVFGVLAAFTFSFSFSLAEMLGVS